MIKSFSNAALHISEGFKQSAVLTLGITVTIGYGTLYYAYGVLASAISADFGIPVDWFFAAFTAGLLFGGLFAPLIGREIDSRGAHAILSIGSLVAGMALVFCALSQNIWAFFFGVVLMELAACLVLYEAAFAALTQVFGQSARPRMAAITLIAGFASTVFWPLTQALLTSFDWRVTFMIFAAIHVLICAPLHWRFLTGAKPLGDSRHEKGSENHEPLHLGAARKRALVLFTLAICGSGFVYASVPIHMLSILQSEGFNATMAALIAMIMGPAQVLARLIELAFGNRFDALFTGRAALISLLLALLIVLISSGSMAAALTFAALYGASQGLITVARGAVPLLLFGARGYATLNGRITGIRFVVNAAGPFFFAFLATRGGVDAALIACGLLAAVSLALFLQLKKPV